MSADRQIKKILLIDNEDVILLALSHLLKSDTTYVRTCNSISEAERVIAKERFDLVITDLRFGGSEACEGLDIISAIKKKSPETHVVLMTGYGSESIREAAVARGAFRYLEKPVDNDVLIRLVNDIC